MQSEKILNSIKKISNKAETVKASKQEKEKDKTFENLIEKSESVQDKFLNKKRGRPKKTESEKKINKKNNNKANNNKDNKSENNLAPSHCLSFIKTSNASEIGKLIDIPIHINLNDFHSTENSEADNELPENTSKENKKAVEANNSKTQLSQSKGKSIQSISPKFKRRNALVVNDLFTATDKSNKKYFKTEKPAKLNNEKKSFKILKKIGRTANTKPLNINSSLQTQTQSENSHPQTQKQCSNKDSKELLILKSSKKENEKYSNINFPIDDAVDLSRSSEKTAHFYNEISTEIEAKTAESNVIYSASGSFVYDIPHRVNKFSVDCEENIFAEIEWKRRYDGSIPSKSLFPLELVQQKCPGLLCEFLVKKFKTKLAKAKVKAGDKE